MPPDSPHRRPTSDSLDSWKAIATYLRRQVRTVQRWEQSEGLPVHRHKHHKQATVYAYRDELDAWRAGRGHQLAGEPRRRSVLTGSAVAVAVVAAGGAAYFFAAPTADENAAAPAGEQSVPQADPIQAAEHLERGYRTLGEYGPEGLPRAMEEFTAALEIDDTLVPAHAGLALTHVARTFFGSGPMSEGYAEAEKWAASALALDPLNADALAVHGWVAFIYWWKWEEAEALFRQAIELRPASMWPYFLYANYLSALDRPEEAIRHITTARRLAPGSPHANIGFGYILSNAALPRRAIEHLEKYVQETDSRDAMRFLQFAYEQAGEFEHAVEMLEALGRADAPAVKQALAANGERGYWRELLRPLDASAVRIPDLFSWRRAVVLTRLGEYDEAIEELEKGYYLRTGSMAYLKVYGLQPLHSHPRFQDLLRRMAFPG